ncbi:MAG: hypothetical protein HQM12_05660 [SAR324 cluster bacterium]|nr:hypothetical protein [SAR324 cluster bacterium]
MKTQDALMKKILNRSIGFTIEEVMSGEHEFVDQVVKKGKLPMEFRVTWGPEQLLQWLNPVKKTFLSQPLKGVVTIDGLCRDTPCQGVLELRYFQEAKIRYRFNFQVQDKVYEYQGEKVNIRPWNLHRTHTTCYGTVRELPSGKEVSKSVVYFRFSTMMSFLGSFRIKINQDSVG